MGAAVYNILETIWPEERPRLLSKGHVSVGDVARAIILPECRAPGTVYWQARFAANPALDRGRWRVAEHMGRQPGRVCAPVARVHRLGHGTNRWGLPRLLGILRSGPDFASCPLG